MNFIIFSQQDMIKIESIILNTLKHLTELLVFDDKNYVIISSTPESDEILRNVLIRNRIKYREDPKRRLYPT